jgi:hypothetical protein
MTTFEQKRAFEILSKKFKDQGQRITNHQSGWVEEFNVPSKGQVISSSKAIRSRDIGIYLTIDLSPIRFFVGLGEISFLFSRG